METNNLLKYGIVNSCCCVDKKDGMAIYELEYSVAQKYEEKKIQVLNIGTFSEKDTKSILLLGETGTGKTRLINSLINHIFDVKFEYPFRLQLKDQLVGEARSQTQSQTDYITAYMIYHRDGMPHDSNYMIIDTPGLNDTRGQHHQAMTMDHLRTFLLKDFGIDHLNCIGVVIKANENRELRTLNEVLSDIMSLLGNDVADITQLLATFAVDKSNVDSVAKEAGIQFVSEYRFDNGPLYEVRETLSQQEQEILKFRWGIMNTECNKFLEATKHAPPISLKKTREILQERQKIDVTLKTLHAEVVAANNIIKPLSKRTSQQQKYKTEASEIKWKKTVSKDLRETLKVEEGYHVHNCNICDKTCSSHCADPSAILNRLLKAGASIAAFGAVAAGGAALGAGAIPLAAAEAVGAEGAVKEISTAINFAAAGISGAFIQAIADRTGLGVCEYLKKGDTCDEDRCTHKRSEHFLLTKKINRRIVEEEIILDHDAKDRYDDIMKKVNDLEELIVLDKKSLNKSNRFVNDNIESLIASTKKIEALSLGSQILDPLKLIDNKMQEVKDDDHIELYRLLRNAIKKAVSKSELSNNV